MKTAWVIIDNSYFDCKGKFFPFAFCAQREDSNFSSIHLHLVAAKKPIPSILIREESLHIALQMQAEARLK